MIRSARAARRARHPLTFAISADGHQRQAIVVTAPFALFCAMPCASRSNRSKGPELCVRVQSHSQLPVV